MIIQITFVPILSFLTPTYSEERLWTDIFGCKFWSKKRISENRLTRREMIIQDIFLNPFPFRKTALEGHFWMQILGSKKQFWKIVKHAVR